MTHSPVLQQDKHLISSSALSLSHAISSAAAVRAIDKEETSMKLMQTVENCICIFLHISFM